MQSRQTQGVFGRFPKFVINIQVKENFNREIVNRIILQFLCNTYYLFQIKCIFLFGDMYSETNSRFETELNYSEGVHQNCTDIQRNEICLCKHVKGLYQNQHMPKRCNLQQRQKLYIFVNMLLLEVLFQLMGEVDIGFKNT